MQLESFCIIHQPKSAPETGPQMIESVAGAALLEALRGTFELNTCQRRLWVIPQSWIARAENLLPFLSNRFEVFHGADAYRFLLNVTTGLASQVRGETDIFGQFKEAWQAFERQGTTSLELLRPWIRKVLEDTKEIRARHLHHVGGASYGSLVRRILRQYREQEPILIVGAGKIAQSIAPWLLEHEVWIWNRSAAARDALVAELRARPGARVRAIESGEEESEAWRNAMHAVICVPYDEEADRRRIEMWQAGDSARKPGRSIIHLGGVKASSGPWKALPRFHGLDDLFLLQKAQDELRVAQFQAAQKACEERALLRSLGGSASLPHGWEDLAAFA